MTADLRLMLGSAPATATGQAPAVTAPPPEIPRTLVFKDTGVEVWVAAGEVIVLGDPAEEDESHNCDAMGCGFWHVVARWRYAGGPDEVQGSGDYTGATA